MDCVRACPSDAEARRRCDGRNRKPTEAYAAKLRQAGNPVTTVRYDGTIHDFMLLNAPSQAKATRAAIAQATAFLRQAFGTD